MSSFTSISASGRIPIATVDDLELYRIEKGSRIETERNVYAHWAVYMGNGKICHLTQDPRERMSGSAVLSSASAGILKAIIIEEDFVVLLQGENPKVYVNNSADSKWKPLPAGDIVKRAHSRRGVSQYSLTTNNCEHFVNWCRYGEVSSQQVNGVAVGGAVLGVLAGLGGILGGMMMKKS